MSGVRHSDLFHTGIVVRDFDAALDEFPPLFGIEWGPSGEADVPVITGDGVPRTVRFRYAYSVEGPVHLELVAAIDDSPWAMNGAGGVHHLGYWSQDVAADSARLADAGAPLVAKIGTDDPAAPPRIAYHERHGSYIELVPIAMRSVLFGGV